MKKINASKYLVLAFAAVVLPTTLSVFCLVDEKKPGQTRTDTSTTTDMAAASAGARVTATEPKLRVEAK